MTRPGRSRGKGPRKNRHRGGKKKHRSGSGPQHQQHRGDRSSGRPTEHEDRDRSSPYRGKVKLPPDAIDKTHDMLAKFRNDAENLKASSGKRNDDLHLDDWQKQVLTYLENGESVIVDAPTTAGKTRAVEFFFRQNLDKPNFRAAYTTPVKSLSNDKLREFREMFGAENVGIATGDFKENLNAPIVVATLECYRNSLLGVDPDLGRTLVVFDEYHFLQDASRGGGWEESIILTPPHCQLLLLSASVENSGEFQKWISSIRKQPCRLVKVEHRPVPLQDLIYVEDEWIAPEMVPNINQFKRFYNKVYEHDPEDIAKRCPSIEKLNLTPCIVYGSRRLSSEMFASAIAKKLAPISQDHAKKISDILQTLQDDIKALSFMPPQLRQMIQHYGVAYHHSGLAPAARIAVEQLIKVGLLRFCCATMGLSIGINFAVRSALIGDYVRPGEDGPTPYSQSEVLQMLGRAGRRGQDPVGYSLWMDLPTYFAMGKSRREACSSRLRNDPTTFLGLVGRNFDLEKIENFYSKSFKRYQDAEINLSIIQKKHLEEFLRAKDLPCNSPVHAVAQYANADAMSPCYSCKYKGKSHEYLEERIQGDLSALHLHLHRLGALDEHEKLTNFGDTARYFPQNGGLLVSHYLQTKKINPENLMAGCELMAALSTASFKEIDTPTSYKFPFDPKQVLKQLEQFYPYDLFPEVYDPPRARRRYSIFRDFNPSAGHIVRMWLTGAKWTEIIAEFVTPYYGTGDIMSLMYRVSTYLQSVMQSPNKDMHPAAFELRNIILREPVQSTIK